jgi:hypothetical protein
VRWFGEDGFHGSIIRWRFGKISVLDFSLFLDVVAFSLFKSRFF